MGKAVKFELEFVKKQKESKDAYTFYFKRPKQFDFFSGQYIKIFLDIENVDYRGGSRYFTISSSSDDKDFLTITTRIIKSSFKLKLNSLPSGSKLMAFGPVGYFDFDPNNNLPNIFLAGGIGVTPFHSFIRSSYMIKDYPRYLITLFASFSHKEDILFFDEFKEYEKMNPSFEVIYTLTKDKDPRFENGRISEEIIKKYSHSYKEANYFITGSETMVSSLYELVLSMGIPEKNIFKEDFPGY